MSTEPDSITAGAQRSGNDQARRWPSRPAAMVVGAALLAAALGWLIAPRPAHLGTRTTGDAALAQRVRDLAPDAPYQGMAVALLEDGEVRAAGLGTTGGADPTPVDADTPFETGSVTKVFTGMLLADLEDAGRLRRDTRLGAVYPAVDFADQQVADLTLAQLSNHRSGLPTTVPAGVGGFLRTLESTWMGASPFDGVRPADLLDAAASVEAGDPATPTYPNFAASLLGHALAEHEQSTYGALVDDRIIAPLGLRNTTIQAPDADPPAGHARPQRSSGTRVEAWVGAGELPAGAGGLWSTATDLARLASATRDGTAPGAAAAQQRYELTDERRVGLGWITTDHDGRTVTWHNGATDGTASFVGYSDDAAVVVLATGGPVGSRSVDSLALGLIGVESDQNTALSSRFYPMLAMTVVLPPMAGLTFLVRARRRGRRAGQPPTDRVGLAAHAVASALLFAVMWRAGLWDRIPPLVWIASFAVFGAGLAIAARRWSALPVIAAGRPWRRWGDLGLWIMAAMAYGALLITTLRNLS